jgi:hypothetical protein
LQEGYLIVFNRASRLLAEHLPGFYTWIPGVTDKVVRWIHHVLQLLSANSARQKLNVTCLGKAYQHRVRFPVELMRCYMLAGLEAPGEALMNVILAIILVVVFEASLLELLYVTLGGCTDALRHWFKKRGGSCVGPLRLVLPGPSPSGTSRGGPRCATSESKYMFCEQAVTKSHVSADLLSRVAPACSYILQLALTSFFSISPFLRTGGVHAKTEVCDQHARGADSRLATLG